MATRKRAGTKFRSNGYDVVTAMKKIRAQFGHPPCRTLRDMSEAEIVAIEHEYGMPVIRP